MWDYYEQDKLKPDAKRLEALRTAARFPVRIKCATLSWHTLAQALAEAEALSPGS